MTLVELLARAIAESAVKLEHEVSRLPKWARNRLETLEMRVRELTAQLSPPSDSNTYADPYGSVSKPLMNDESVRFVFEKHFDDRHGRYVEDSYADVRIRDGSLYVSVHPLLVVCPEASNAVRIEVIRRGA